MNLETNISVDLFNIKSAADDIRRNRVISRIWQKDYRIWAPLPTEISNRLGWLTLPDTMPAQIDALNSFAAEIRESGFRYVVLLGMGGSSLGAEVMRQTLGNATGFPRLFVLDSTVPGAIENITRIIEPPRTLFIVSSKSGTTTETNLLYAYFENLVISSIGKSRAGDNFIAITDPGTPLERLASEKKFRRIFLAPEDIGGRYSVLSVFGLVPAALLGVDISVLLERAAQMRRDANHFDLGKNAAAKLGVLLGSLALQGRDKCTLITSSNISSFGLWAEQLIAESTGKDGKGIVPVIGEPLMAPSHYGNDRIFVYLRVRGEDNSTCDRAVEDIKDTGQPVILLELCDKMDIGAEFFRWEFAIAVAAAILRVNPFNQPDVEATKSATEGILQKAVQSGCLPEVTLLLPPAELLNRAQPGDYLAILTYLEQSSALDNKINMLRSKITQKYHIATTAEYGPRYLHSIGQLHKGGPNNGLFLEICGEYDKDLEIPGKPYTFGMSVNAQAVGDLQVLQSRGRCVARIQTKNDMEALNSLLASL